MGGSCFIFGEALIAVKMVERTIYPDNWHSMIPSIGIESFVDVPNETCLGGDEAVAVVEDPDVFMEVSMVFVERIDHHLEEILRVRPFVSFDEVDHSFLTAFAVSSC